MNNQQLLCFCVPFLKNENDKWSYFGAYPTDSQLRLLKDTIDIKLIVDLTEPGEKKCVQYAPVEGVSVIHYSIPDRKGPSDKLKFCKLVLVIADALTRNETVYIHCKGGHGRSGMLAAALLCYITHLSPKEAILHTTECHSNRIGLKPYWLKLGSPQTWDQKQTIYTMFKSHYITELSPFYSDSDDDIYLDSFLLQTYLGRIIGEKGSRLESRRKKVITSMY